MSKQPKPDCKIGDILRLEEEPLEWSGSFNYHKGSLGTVISIDDDSIMVAPENKAQSRSAWWRNNLDGQPRLSVIPNISDEQVETTKKALQKLLKQL